jgi:Holliday junction resolvase RusA-like endonuclease
MNVPLHIIPILPVATPRPKIRVMNMRGKRVPQAYYPDKYKKYKEDLAILLAASGIKPGVYSKLAVVFFLPYPKGTAKKRLIEGIPHQKKPDGDNFLKGLMDGLEAAEITGNDSNFYSIHIMKLYTIGAPRIQFKLS